jgi:hypothetical protein
LAHARCDLAVSTWPVRTSNRYLPLGLGLTRVVPGSSSHGLCTLFRVRHSYHPASRPQAGSTFLGFRSPSRHQSKQSTCSHLSHDDLGPPPAFLTLSTGYSCLLRAGLFHPAATSKIFSSRAFPGKPAVVAFTTRCLPAVFTQSLRPSLLSTVPVLCVRLQGFSPASGPLPLTEVLRLPTPDPLLNFHTFRFVL